MNRVCRVPVISAGPVAPWQMATQELHLIGQYIAIRQDQVLNPAGPVGNGQQWHVGFLGGEIAFVEVAGHTGGDDIFPLIAAPARIGYDMVTGQRVAMPFLATVHAQVVIAGEQGDVSQCRCVVQRLTATMPGTGDDRVELQNAGLAAESIGASVQGDTWLTQGPGYRPAYIQAGGVLPADPVKDATAGVECQYPGMCGIRSILNWG